MAVARCNADSRNLPFIMTTKSRSLVIGGTLLLAVLAFEIFNFDTTRLALRHLLGPSDFMGVTWATILAIAFSSLDFAGLLHLFTADSDEAAPTYVWYMMGAWLCGATVNAALTWYAVSLTLLEFDGGNAILSHEQLFQVVPVLVAFLVWLTRVFFVASLALMGDALTPLSYTSRYRIEEIPPHQLSTEQPARLRPANQEPTLSTSTPPPPRIRHQQD